MIRGAVVSTAAPLFVAAKTRCKNPSYCIQIYHKKLKYSPLGTFLRVCMCQIFYLGIFTLLTLAGFSSVCVQYLAVPIFGVLFCLLVQADRGMILFIQQLKEQLETNTRNQAMERLLQIQHDQYSMLQARIAENRRARHDFRQHLRVIQDCVKRGDLEDLKSYLAEYEKQFPSHSDHIYCNSYAVNAILAFYADKADHHSIRLDVKIQMSDTPVIPETEFCVLLGNLLENALDACQTGHSGSETAQPFIRVCAVQTGTSTLSITVDNTSVFKPTWIHEKLVSTKAAGSGIGTESIRMIAEQYHGDARFEWRDGVFYASVMLNP